MKQGFVVLVLLACWGCGGGSGIETSGGNNGPKVYSSGRNVAFQVEGEYVKRVQVILPISDLSGIMANISTNARINNGSFQVKATSPAGYNQFLEIEGTVQQNRATGTWVSGTTWTQLSPCPPCDLPVTHDEPKKSGPWSAGIGTWLTEGQAPAGIPYYAW